jgi:hypothetical protein
LSGFLDELSFFEIAITMPENLMFLDRLVLSSYLYELAGKVQQKVNNRSINYFYDDYVEQSRLSFYIQS